MNSTDQVLVARQSGSRIAFEGEMLSLSSPRKNWTIVNPSRLIHQVERRYPKTTDSDQFESKNLVEPSISFTANALKESIVVRNGVEEPVPTTKLLGQWEGYVLSTDGEAFTARLIDTMGNDPDYEAEFEIESISKQDHDLIQAGAVFYWSITYFRRVDGNISTMSDIRFRRLPVWTQQELQKAKQKADSIAELLGI